MRLSEEIEDAENFEGERLGSLASVQRHGLNQSTAMTDSRVGSG